MNIQHNERNTYRLLIVLVFVSLIPYFWGLAKPDIQDIDEAAYAEIAREAVVSGNWIDHTLNYKPFDQHPPLGTWVMAASLKIFGVTPLAARLPNAILAVLGLLITYLIARRISDRKTGILAALALSTAPAYHLMVRDARLDMTLMVCIALALWGVISYLAQPKKYYLVVAYIGAGLAFMTKGPIGLVIPLLVVGVYIIMTRRWNLIWKLGLPWGLVVIAAVLFPWYWAMYKAHGWDYLYTLFIVQNFKRFATTNYAGKSDPFFYVHTFLWMFLPWVVALFWRLIRDFSDFRKARFDLKVSSPKDPSTALMTIWLIAPIVLMSFSRTKLPQYIFFVLPAAAVIAGRFLKDYIDGTMTDRGQQGFSIYTFALTILLLCALAVVVTLMFPFADMIWYLPFAAALVFLAALGLASLVRKRRTIIVVALCLTVGLIHSLILWHVSPSMLEYQPYKGFAADLSVAGIQDKDVYFVGRSYKSSFLFYSGRRAVPVENEDFSVLDEATKNGKSAIIIAPAEIVPKLENAGFVVEIISTRKYFHTSLPNKKFLFAKTREDAAIPMILGRITRVSVP